MKRLFASTFGFSLLAAGAAWNSAALRQTASFEPNRGQTSAEARFIGHLDRRTFFLTVRGVVVAVDNAEPLRIELLGSDPQTSASGQDRLPGVTNFLFGNQPEKWALDLPRYQKVRFENVYRGVDLVYYFNNGNLEHDFLLAPGASWRAIRFRVQGARRLHLDESGDLLVETAAGTLRQKKPVIYQQIAGEKINIAGGYLIRNSHEYTFTIAAYDPKLPLTIDPVILFSSYLSGGGSDQPNSIVLDTQGNAYVTGSTTSINFPEKGAVQPANAGGNDVFVTKLDGASGAIVYSTYLGGSGDDFGVQIKVDSAGNACVAGTTTSSNFPSVGKLQAQYGGGLSDAFVLKLNAAGNALLYSTYLGGSDADGASGLDLDSQGNAYVVGATYSTNFPTTHPALQNFAGGGLDGFIAKIDSAGTHFVYSSYLGGQGNDAITAVSVNTLGEPYVVGWTASTNLSTTPAGSRWPFLAGGLDAFMARIAASGFAYDYISYYGGSLDDIATSVAVDPTDPSVMYIGILTESPDFPTPNGAGTGLAPGQASHYVARFVIPSSSPALVAGRQSRAAAPPIDDYDWLSSLDKAVEILDQPPPNWDDLLKKLESSDKTFNKNLDALLKKLGEIAVDRATKAMQEILKDIGDGLDVGELIRNLVNGTNTSTSGSSKAVPAASTQPLLFALSRTTGNVAVLSGFPGGPAAAFTDAVSMTTDSSGNVYVAAQSNDATLPVSASGAQPGSGTSKGYVVKFPAGEAQSNGPAVNSVTNAFDSDTTIAPNTWVAIKGINLAPVGDSRIWAIPDFINNQLPVNLDGVTVTMNGVNAYIWYISPTQLNVLTPPTLASGPVQVVVTNGSASPAFVAQAAVISLSVFSVGATGQYVLATHGDGTYVGPTTLYPGLSTPAKPNETVVVYANGFGLTSAPIVPGAEAQSGTLPTMPTAQIGGLAAPVSYAALQSPGTFQLNIQIPANIPDGDQPITVQYNGQTTQTGVAITIQH